MRAAMSLEDRVLEIVNRSEISLTIEAVSQVYAKDVEKDIKAALDSLAEQDRVKKTRGQASTLPPTIEIRRIGALEMPTGPKGEKRPADIISRVEFRCDVGQEFKILPYRNVKARMERKRTS